jgi:hypothetical protein
MPNRTTERQMRVSKTGHTNHDRQESTGGNSVLPQLAVTCKIEAECFYQTFVQVDSFVLHCLPAGRENRTKSES